MLVCHDPLDGSEETFIIQWVKNNQTQYDVIHWKDLVSAIKDQFSKLRSENKLKNFWYSKRGQLLFKNCVSYHHSKMKYLLPMMMKMEKIFLHLMQAG